jgi:DNA-binding NarL/FixJ family response regulator
MWRRSTTRGPDLEPKLSKAEVEVEPVRVVIGEDEALFREGLTHVLRAAGFDVLAAAGDAEELMQLTAERLPDLVITDIRMPPGLNDDGLQAALSIRSTLPGTAVVVLSQHVQRRYATELLGGSSGGVGYLLKQRVTDTTTFSNDLRRVCAGATVLDPEVVALMVARAARHDLGVERLTARQREVLTLMAEGRSNVFIARSLFISEKAVVQHVSHIYDQLGLPESDDDHRRVLAVLHYLSGNDERPR